MAWYLFVKKATGDLVSEGSVIPDNLDIAIYDVIDNGTRPDWTVQAWNPTLRALYTRPLPIVVDRLDDIRARMMADTDFVAVWNNLTPARRTQIRTGIDRVLSLMMGERRFRGESDRVELD